MLQHFHYDSISTADHQRIYSEKKNNIFIALTRTHKYHRKPQEMGATLPFSNQYFHKKGGKDSTTCRNLLFIEAQCRVLLYLFLCASLPLAFLFSSSLPYLEFLEFFLEDNMFSPMISQFMSNLKVPFFVMIQDIISETMEVAPPAKINSNNHAFC